MVQEETGIALWGQGEIVIEKTDGKEAEICQVQNRTLGEKHMAYLLAF